MESKKVIKAAKQIVKIATENAEGYWADAVLEYNKTLPFHIMREANLIAQAVLKGNRNI